MKKNYTFTSESVSAGHPDKICDQVSDAILDALLAQDPGSRVAVETAVKDNNVILAGEVTTTASIDYEAIVRDTIKKIGYTDPNIGFDYQSCKFLNLIGEQSPDISQGVTEGEGTHQEQGAGDQGIMFGYATNETPEGMPLAIQLSHRLLEELSAIRESAEGAFLRPDAKSQVTIDYVDGKPARVNTIVVSTQHTEEVSTTELRELIISTLIPRVIPTKLLDDKTIYHINPTGKFVIGGPVGDAGLTGRKIIVDTYGGKARHGGGAFSGKDPSKVDRSAAYAARYIARNVVAAGLASECEVQLAYAIGFPEPVSIFLETFGTATVEEEIIEQAIKENFALSPRGLIEELDLLKPIYSKSAAYGHFGRKVGANGEFSWERTDKVEALQQSVAALAKKAAA